MKTIIASLRFLLSGRSLRTVLLLCGVGLGQNIGSAQDVPAERRLLSLERFREVLGEDEFGASVGHEFSALRDRTGSGVKPPDWQESFVSVYWHQPEKQTWEAEYRRLQRFGSTANQMRGFWTSGWLGDWRVRANAGAALSGDFIPRWRLGSGGTYRFTEQVLAHADVNYLRFTDIDVVQGDVGLTWRWQPQFSSEAFVYVSNNEFSSGAAGGRNPPPAATRNPSGGSSQGYMFSLNTTWDYAQGSWVRVLGSVGDEDVSQVRRELIGEQHFYSVGAEWRLRCGRNWSVQPNYRYERHQQFDLHAIGLSLFYSF